MDFEDEINCEVFFIKINHFIKKLTQQGIQTSYTNLHINLLHDIKKYATLMDGASHIFSDALTQWHAKSDADQTHKNFKMHFDAWMSIDSELSN